MGEEMFLPVEIGRNIVDFEYTGQKDITRKLVRSVEILKASKNRPPLLHKPLAARPESLASGRYGPLLWKIYYH
jgi:hypothetical protein